MIATGPGRAVEHDDGRSGALDLVGGRESVGIDGRHRATIATGILAPMPSLIVRAATGIDDLRTATDLLSAAWRAGSPLVAGTPASVEWWHALSLPMPLGDHLRLWSEADGGRPSPGRGTSRPSSRSHVWTGDRGSRHRGIPDDRRSDRSTRPATASCRRSPPTTTRPRSTSSRRSASRRRGAGCRNGSAGASDGRAGGAPAAGRLPDPRPVGARRIRGPRRAPSRRIPEVARSASTSTSGCTRCRTTGSRTTSWSRRPTASSRRSRWAGGTRRTASPSSSRSARTPTTSGVGCRGRS